MAAQAEADGGMTSDPPLSAAIALVEQALALIDEHNVGVFAAPHLDLGLVKLRAEMRARDIRL